jgi:acyl-CoA reductase-like NAD-dependent aldehyde dehydrogenase
MFHELSYVRREAQAEADLAYDAWCRHPGRDRYAVYRAAQDRADAAQDGLATWVRSNQHVRHTRAGGTERPGRQRYSF